MTNVQKKSVEPDAAGLYFEQRVSEALGVPRKLLAQLRARHLKEGGDFVRQAANAVALTAAGLKKIEDLIAKGAGAAGPGKPGKTAGKPPINGSADVPVGPPKKDAMTVERVAQNTQLMLCRSKATNLLVAVRVKDNTNFRPGMTFEAMESHDGVWQFRNRPESAGGNESTVGRLPRGTGRW